VLGSEVISCNPGHSGEREGGDEKADAQACPRSIHLGILRDS